MKVRLKILLFILFISILSTTYISFAKIDLFSSRALNIESKQIKYPVIDFGYEIWPGYLLITLANKLGYFKDEGIVVNEKAYDENEKLTYDFNRGFLEAKADYASAVVDNESKGNKPGKIVLSTDYSLGGDGLVARKGVVPFRESINPRVGYAGNFDFFIYWIIKTLGKTKDTITLIHEESDEEALKALLENRVDYLYTYDPFLSEAVEMGGNLEYSSKNIPGIVVDSIIFDNEYIANNPKAIDAFISAYFRAYEYWEDNKKSSYELVGPIYEISKEEFELQMGKIKMLNLEENSASMEMSAGINSLYGHLRIVSMFMTDFDSSYSNINHYNLVYPDSVKKLLNANNGI